MNSLYHKAEIRENLSMEAMKAVTEQSFSGEFVADLKRCEKLRRIR